MAQIVSHVGSRALTLAQHVSAGRPPTLVEQGGLIAFPKYWQVPAATEKAAYEAIRLNAPSTDFEYFAFPWATLVDGLRGDAAVTADLLCVLRQAHRIPSRAKRRVTVMQHIHAVQYVAFLRLAGITDVFWSHATHSLSSIDGLTVHAFPLFPAQTPNEVPPREGLDRPRRYLTNFIGAYNPKIYLTSVRAAILADAGREPDIRIVKREAWHFDRAVYEEQIKGLAPDAQRRLVEQKHAEEYVQAIRDSWFTLCPSGSGPNSIRIFESLCLGSIPIVLTRDLRLAGPQALWERAAIIDDDSIDGYRRALAAARAMPQSARIAMLQAGRDLCNDVLPGAYHRVVTDAIVSVRRAGEPDY
jgi:hypothetical protein